MRSRTALAASLLMLGLTGAACPADSNTPIAGIDKFDQRERQLLDKLEGVRQREREIQTKLEDVRRRKQAVLSRVATRTHNTPGSTPPPSQ